MPSYSDGAAVARAFFDCWNAGDPDGIGALFAEDADFVNVVGIWWQNRRAIRKAHDYGFKRIFMHAKLTITELKVRELRPDIHIVHTVSTLEGQVGPDGMPAAPRISVISMVTERRGESFVIISFQNTDRVEGADTHIADASGFRPASYRKR